MDRPPGRVAGTTAGVRVNLTLRTATGIGVSIHGFELVTGSAGNDILVGDAGSNALLGGAGADSVDGGTGRDIVVAAATYGAANPTALESILAQHLATASGLARSWFNNVVFDDNIADRLFGASTALFVGRTGINGDTITIR